MRVALFLILPLFIQLYANAQASYKGRVVDEKQQPIQDVNIIIYQSATSIISYGFSDGQGKFDVACPDKNKANSIGFILMGFETLQIPIKEFKDGQTIVLKNKTFQLKEVNIRPDKIIQRDDTLVYNVLSFKQAQDRSIADVIAKMPGLEVQQNGRISFEGKPINKFYIEGMDLMGAKYAQASENLNANMIHSVQVIQNHQPIKTLKGVQFSDQAALNIVLKEDVKNVWAGVLDVSMGSAIQKNAEYLYSGRLLGMIFGRKRQNLSMYKNDNTGKNISKEVTDLTTMLWDNQKEDGLLRNLAIPAAEVDEQRTTFSNSHLVATNHLIKNARDNDVRIQLDYLWNKKEGNNLHTTEYLDLDGVILSEENETVTRSSRLNGNLTYKVNKDKLYINNRLCGDMDFNKNHGSTLLNNGQISQYVKLRKSHLTEDFTLISRLKNGNSIEVSSQSTYSYLPGQLLTVEGATEQLDITAFETHNYAAFSHKIKGFIINHKMGYNLKKQQIDVTYQNLDEQEDYIRQNIYLASSLHFEKKSFKMRATVQANAMHQQYRENQSTRFSIYPNLNMQYDCSSTTSASINYSYRKRENSLTSIYRTPIFTSYRTQASHTGELTNRGIHTASLYWKYQQPIKGRFLNMNFSWVRRTNEQLYQGAYDAPVYKRTPTAHRYDADTYLIGGNASHSFYWGRTTVSLGCQQMWSNYYLLQNEEKTPWQIRNTELTFKLAMQPHRIFSYEFSSQMQTNKQINRTDKALSGDRLTKFNHSIALFFFPIKNLEVGVENDFYHTSDTNTSSNFFTDTHLSYQWKRYELRLIGNNLFGNHLYAYRMHTSVTNVYSAYRLRPRELLLHFSIDF